jgi:type IV secretion system protein VirB10
MTSFVDETTAPPLPPKEDPEKLELRGRPRQVVRFRRGLLVTIAAGLCAGIAALTWVALEPHGFRLALSDDDGRPFERPHADALAGAPGTYSDIPKLGPPLPGDLGRPILEQQRRSAAAASAGPPAAIDPGVDAAAAALQKRLAEEQAARTSALLAQLSGRPRPPAGGSESVPPAAQSAPVESAEGSQAHKVAFVNGPGGTVDPHSITAPPSAWTLAAGTIIPASLITGLNSDLPGLVLAQVTENVRDSATGHVVLVPQGARLIGRYDSSVTYGQRRALLVWDRILFPDGSSIEHDKMPATDTSGYAGLQGQVNSHPWQLVKGVVLSTALGLGSELSFGGGGAVARAIRESAQQSGSRAGDQLVGRSLDVQPTLTVPPGWPVRALLAKDLVLQPWKG